MSVPSSTVLLMHDHCATTPSVGHYRVRCPPGTCAAESVPGTSNRERDIFATLGTVLGRGKYNYVVPGCYVAPADMAFPIDDRLILVVEYDADHWHNGREIQDRRKLERISEIGPWDPHEVVRIREAPLRPLRANDVWVPSRADSYTCSRLALQHIAHRFFHAAFRYETRIRIEHFLAAASTPLARKQVPCKECWQLTRAVRRAQARLAPVVPPPWTKHGQW
jgi:hypothetical protein